MDRRKFITYSGAGAAAAAATVLTDGPLGSSVVEAQRAAATRKPLLCKLGSNCSAYNAADLVRVGRFGVTTIVSGVTRADSTKLAVTTEDLMKMRELPEKHGIKVTVLTPPQLSSSHIDREANPYIMLGKSPERDREIEAFQTTIKSAAAAGIPCIKYNMSLLGVLRNGTDQGRSDTSHRSFDMELAKKTNPTLPLTKAGVVNADMYWERITYFLERVVPVATEYKVRIACHPNDSIVPDGGYQGIDPVLSRPEGLKKFVTIKESPYHGLNLCLGTLSEMLMNPAEDIWEPLTWLASRKKIFNVHFRNIKGNRLHYNECAPDEGVVDFTRAVLVLAQNGYDGHITPDHNVAAKGDTTDGEAYNAFVYGYIAASIKSAGRQLNS
jgi:mannonate dehydratase